MKPNLRSAKPASAVDSFKKKKHEICLPLRPHTCRQAQSAHICIGASFERSSNLKNGWKDLMHTCTHLESIKQLYTC